MQETQILGPVAVSADHIISKPGQVAVFGLGYRSAVETASVLFCLSKCKKLKRQIFFLQNADAQCLFDLFIATMPDGTVCNAYTNLKIGENKKYFEVKLYSN